MVLDSARNDIAQCHFERSRETLGAETKKVSY